MLSKDQSSINRAQMESPSLSDVSFLLGNLTN